MLLADIGVGTVINVLGVLQFVTSLLVCVFFYLNFGSLIASKNLKEVRRRVHGTESGKGVQMLLHTCSTCGRGRGSAQLSHHAVVNGSQWLSKESDTARGDGRCCKTQ